jgi:alpha/beta superfamily hydrolase
MDTDPTEGTNPDKILTGLLRYAKKRGYALERLELASWRGVSQSNQKYLIGTKPNLSWMKAAAKNPDVVTIFNFGWYVKSDNGDIRRHSGHW